MPTLIIKNWERGIASKPRLGGIRDSAGSPIFPMASAQGIDPYRIPGIAMAGKLSTIISSTTVVDLPVHVVINGTDSWWLGQSGNIYKVTNANVVTKPHTSSNPEGYGLTLHHDGTAKYLYWRSDQEIGRFDLASTYNDDYITGLTSQGAGQEAPLISFINNLYFANGSYIGRKEGGAAENKTYLQLPANFYCKQILIYGTWLILNLKSTETNADSSKIVFWDGIKTDYQDVLPIPANEITLYNDDNQIMGMFGSVQPQLSKLIGRSFQRIKRLESFVAGDLSTAETIVGLNLPRPGAIASINNETFFGRGPNLDIYSWGAKQPDLADALQKPILVDTGTSGQIGCLLSKTSDQSLYVGYEVGAGGSYKIARIVSGVKTGSVFTTPVLDMNTRRKKQIDKIRLYHLTHASGNQIKLEAKKDGGSWTELFTTTFTDDGTVDIKKYDWGLDSKAREYEFKVTYTTTGEDVGVYSIEVDWKFAAEK